MRRELRYELNFFFSIKINFLFLSNKMIEIYIINSGIKGVDGGAYIWEEAASHIFRWLPLITGIYATIICNKEKKKNYACICGRRIVGRKNEVRYQWDRQFVWWSVGNLPVLIIFFCLCSMINYNYYTMHYWSC